MDVCDDPTKIHDGMFGMKWIIYDHNTSTWKNRIYSQPGIPHTPKPDVFFFFKSGLFGVSIPGDLSLGEIRFAKLNWFAGSRNHQHYVFQQISGLENKKQRVAKRHWSCYWWCGYFLTWEIILFLKGNVKRNEFLTWLLDGTLWKVQVSGSPAWLHGFICMPLSGHAQCRHGSSREIITASLYLRSFTKKCVYIMKQMYKYH